MAGPPKSKLYSVGAISLAVGVILFLALAPAVEREAYLSQIRSDDAPTWESAIRHLCWIAPGREGLNKTLAEVERDHRLGVLAEAEAQGCLSELEPRWQAEFWVWNPGVQSAHHRATALTTAAVEPARDALDADDPEVAEHAELILRTLQEFHGEREEARLAALDDARFAALEVASPDLALEPSDEQRTADAVQDAKDVVESAAEIEAPELEIDPLKLQLRPPQLDVESGRVLFDRTKSDESQAPEQEATTPSQGESP